jgi:hypothetical protein
MEHDSEPKFFHATSRLRCHETKPIKDSAMTHVVKPPTHEVDFQPEAIDPSEPPVVF